MKKNVILFFCMVIFVQALALQEIHHPSTERIARLKASIEQNCTQNRRVRAIFTISGLAAMGYGLYWMKTHHNTVPQDWDEVIKRMSPEQIKEWADYGLAMLWRDHDGAGIAFKRFGVWLYSNLHYLANMAGSVVATNIFARGINRIDALFNERDLNWFVNRRTHLPVIVRELKTIAVQLNPDSPLLNVLNGVTLSDQVLDSSAQASEMVRLRIDAFTAKKEHPLLPERKQELYDQLVYTFNRLVDQVEKVTAFLQYQLPDGNECIQQLVRETQHAAVKLENMLKSSDESDVLPVIFVYCFHIERILAWANQFEQERQEKTTVQA